MVAPLRRRCGAASERAAEFERPLLHRGSPPRRTVSSGGAKQVPEGPAPAPKFSPTLRHAARYPATSARHQKVKAVRRSTKLVRDHRRRNFARELMRPHHSTPTLPGQKKAAPGGCAFLPQKHGSARRIEPEPNRSSLCRFVILPAEAYF